MFSSDRSGTISGGSADRLGLRPAMDDPLMVGETEEIDAADLTEDESVAMDRRG